jgi:cytochrome c6
VKKVVFLCTAILVPVLFCLVLPVNAAPKISEGEEAFVKNCAVCHADGGNIIRPTKTLHKSDLAKNGIKTTADIVANMRNPGPAMTKFDEKVIPDKTAKAIAEYILKTFK